VKRKAERKRTNQKTGRKRRRQRRQLELLKKVPTVNWNLQTKRDHDTPTITRETGGKLGDTGGCIYSLLVNRCRYINLLCFLLNLTDNKIESSSSGARYGSFALTSKAGY